MISCMTDHKAKYRRIMELEDEVQNMEHHMVRSINELDELAIRVDSVIMAAVAFENEAFGITESNPESQSHIAPQVGYRDILRYSIDTWNERVGEMKDYEDKLQSFHSLSRTHLERIKSIRAQVGQAKENLYNFPSQ